MVSFWVEVIPFYYCNIHIQLILFGESTSALNNEAQTSIQKAIENMKNEYANLVIVYRLSTFKR